MRPWISRRMPVLLRETAPTPMTELAQSSAQVASPHSGLCVGDSPFQALLTMCSAAPRRIAPAARGLRGLSPRARARGIARAAT